MSKQFLGDLEINQIYEGDCLEGMRRIPDRSIDMVLCDLPYGNDITHAKWDKEIPVDILWEQYMRITTERAAIVLTCQEPLTSKLVLNDVKNFRHKRVWHKDKCSNFLMAKYQPKKLTEDILVFSKAGFTHNARTRATYNPIMEDRITKHSGSDGSERSGHANQIRTSTLRYKNDKNYDGKKVYPSDYIYAATEHFERVHPTQKPVDLFSYLIRTYTNPGEIVLDNCMGSGTTAIAAVRTGRNFIGFEREPEYVEIANRRLDKAVNEMGD